MKREKIIPFQMSSGAEGMIVEIYYRLFEYLRIRTRLTEGVYVKRIYLASFQRRNLASRYC
jgi:hypothetical protein